MTKLRVYVDMDDVVVDLLGGLRALWPDANIGDDIWDIDKVLGITHAQFWAKIVETPYFWEDLDFTPQGRDLIDWLDDRDDAIDWAFASSPSRCPLAAHGKYKWIAAHAKHKLGSTVLLEEKWRLAQKNVVLIDDRDYNLDAFEREGGIAIPWPRGWNKAKADSIRAFQVVTNNLERLLQHVPTTHTLNGEHSDDGVSQR